MRRAVIGGVVFGTGVTLMCIAGQYVALDWMETALMVGTGLMVGAGMYLSRVLECLSGEPSQS